MPAQEFSVELLRSFIKLIFIYTAYSEKYVSKSDPEDAIHLY